MRITIFCRRCLNSVLRRSSQLRFWYILYCVLKMIAQRAPHTFCFCSRVWCRFRSSFPRAAFLRCCWLAACALAGAIYGGANLAAEVRIVGAIDGRPHSLEFLVSETGLAARIFPFDPHLTRVAEAFRK